MEHQDEDRKQRTTANALGPVGANADLLARYGAHLEDEHFNDGDKEAFLLALWQIMQGFVDLGFSVKAGDKFYANAELGMDDVLQFLILEDTAHKSVAPPLKRKTKEQP